AIEKYEVACVQCTSIGNRQGIANCLLGIGYYLSNNAASLENLESAHKHYIALGDKQGIANCLRCIGDLLHSQDNYATAMKKFEAAY
ncbi:hypothetical protein AX17_006378, partial [Amanita inopinata Kibby_2008]